MHYLSNRLSTDRTDYSSFQLNKLPVAKPHDITVRFAMQKKNNTFAFSMAP